MNKSNLVKKTKQTFAKRKYETLKEGHRFFFCRTMEKMFPHYASLVFVKNELTLTNIESYIKQLNDETIKASETYQPLRYPLLRFIVTSKTRIDLDELQRLSEEHDVAIVDKSLTLLSNPR